MMMKKQLILLIFGLAVLAGCKKDSDNNSTPALTVDSAPQAKFKIDGTDVSVVETADITNSTSKSASLAIPPDSSSASYGTGFYDDANSTDVFGVDVGRLEFLGNMPTDADFEALLLGSKNYISDPDVFNGVALYYYINGVKWATNLGTGIQTGSTFTFTDQKTQTSLGFTNVTVLANFNCTLYDGAGNSKVVTDGVFVGAFENY